MLQTIRKPEILEIARRDGKVTVEGLARHFNVTLQTIRRDLTELGEAGRLERVHGGAVLPSGTINIRYDERRYLNSVGKDLMATECAKRISDNSTVFLNIGTSTEAVANALRRHKNLLIVTNNMNIANILGGNDACRVVVTGGALRPSDGGLVGDITTAAIAQFKFDVGVIGCSAIDHDGDILDYDMQEVGVARKILDHSRRTILLADHTKFTRTAPARIASMSDVDDVYTDKPLPPALQSDCDRWKTNVFNCAHPEPK